MTAALPGPAFLKAADTLSDELNQQLIQKSAAGGRSTVLKNTTNTTSTGRYHYTGQRTIQLI